MSLATDGQQIPLPGVNDYSGQVLKDERAEFDSSGSLATMRVCTSSQGGLLDNPGLVTAGCGNVLDKWDQVWREKTGGLEASYRSACLYILNSVYKRNHYPSPSGLRK